MMLIVEVVSLLLGVMYVVESTAKRAPFGVCASMNPIRDVEPQTGHSPYRFKFMIPQTDHRPYQAMDGRNEIFAANESIILMINAYYPRKFIGFLAQARDAQDQPIGYFDIYSYKIDADDCFGYDRNMAVPSREIVIEEIDMHWFPPFDFTGEVTFCATVVENRTVVWAKHRVSPNIIVK